MGFRECCNSRMRCYNTVTLPTYIRRNYVCSVCKKKKTTYEVDGSLSDLKYDLKTILDEVTLFVNKYKYKK